METIYFNESLCKGAAAFNRIAFLQEQIRSSNGNPIRIFIQSNGRIGLTFVFLLGCLPLYGESCGKRVQLVVSPKVYRLLSQINVIDYYRARNVSDDSYQITFDDLLKQPAFKQIQTSADIISFVRDIQMKVPLHLSSEMEDALISRIGEVYQNALEHSNADIIAGGKYFKSQKNKYCFSCYDNGIGITRNVNSFFIKHGFPEKQDDEALMWAMQRGNSTNEQLGVPRGVGLDLLRSFAISKSSVIRICSGRSLYVLNGRGIEKYYKLKNFFYGTLFEMDIFSDSIKFKEENHDSSF